MDVRNGPGQHFHRDAKIFADTKTAEFSENPDPDSPMHKKSRANAPRIEIIPFSQIIRKTETQNEFRDLQNRKRRLKLPDKEIAE